MSDDVLAWHFVGDKLRDGRPVPRDGEVLRHDGELVMCQRGLHASEQIRDALQYAPNVIVCRVRCAVDIARDLDKLVCRERTILWRLDATELLREFARMCALDVTHLWAAPEIVMDYLRTGDETKRTAARDAAVAEDARITERAARAAAEAAAWDAGATERATARAAAGATERAAARAAAAATARAAAGATERAAARAVAWAAAWDAAGDAAWAAAGDAAGAAAWDAGDAAWAAAWDAAWAPAWAAARAAQNERLTAMVEAAHAVLR